MPYSHCQPLGSHFSLNPPGFTDRGHQEQGGHPGAQGSDALQSNHNLLLTENVEIDTKPQLEIWADDVKCSHGSTSGAIDDTALFYLLLATGARPLEVARLEVRDYLNADGTVRRTSSLRAEFAINGRSRPLFFRSARLDEAMDAYLGQRIRRGLSMSGAAAYRGLVPDSRLFLSASGEGFEIKPYGVGAQRRFLCRGIQETYRKIFHYAELEKVTALTIRHTVADRLYRRGADEMQVGLLLGITERSAVREQFPRPQPSLDELTDDLI